MTILKGNVIETNEKAFYLINAKSDENDGDYIYRSLRRKSLDKFQTSCLIITSSLLMGPHKLESMYPIILQKMVDSMPDVETEYLEGALDFFSDEAYDILPSTIGHTLEKFTVEFFDLPSGVVETVSFKYEEDSKEVVAAVQYLVQYYRDVVRG